MHRLFVAIRPPGPLLTALDDAIGGIAGARWQAADQLHLTLRYIGEVDRRQAEDIAVALATVRHRAFSITLAGTGWFDGKAHGSAVWAGVTPRETLAGLHGKIDRVLQTIGLPAEGRTYLPHITLARLSRSAGSPAEMLARTAGLTSDPVQVTAFGLFESHLSRDGASYECVATYPLG